MPDDEVSSPVALPFLSQEWSEALSQTMEGVGAVRAGLSCSIQWTISHLGEDIPFACVVEDGRLTRCSRGRTDQPEVELVTTGHHAWAVWSGASTGNRAMQGFGTRAPGATGEPEPIAPLDLRRRPELDELPRVPGADLTVQYEYVKAPFGPVFLALTFVDGRVADVDLEELDDPDVRVRSTLLQMAQVRRGEISILDALAAGAQVVGPEGALALLGGLCESPEFHVAERACGPSGMALAVLGEIGSDAGVVAAREGLAARTSEPE